MLPLETPTNDCKFQARWLFFSRFGPSGNVRGLKSSDSKHVGVLDKKDLSRKATRERVSQERVTAFASVLFSQHTDKFQAKSIPRSVAAQLQRTPPPPLEMDKMGTICHLPRALLASIWEHCSQVLAFTSTWGPLGCVFSRRLGILGLRRTVTGEFQATVCGVTVCPFSRQKGHQRPKCL